MDINSVVDCAISVNRVLARTDGGNKGGLTLKMQILLAAKNLGGEISVKEIFERVKIVKSNLAILCNNMCKENLIEKVKIGGDGRHIKYKLLERGRGEVETFLLKSENCFKKILSSSEIAKLEEATKTIVDILK